MGPSKHYLTSMLKNVLPENEVIRFSGAVGEGFDGRPSKVQKPTLRAGFRGSLAYVFAARRTLGRF